MDAKNLKVIIAGFVVLVGIVTVGAYVRSDGGILTPSEEEGYGAAPGPEIQDKVTFAGGEPIINPIVVATTTAGSAATLVANDFLRADYHIVTPGGLVSAADLTYTFPASSTLKSFVNKIGAREQHCFFMSATTTDSNIIFAAGTGIDFKYASSTLASDGVPSLAIGSENEACFTFIRQPDNSTVRGLGDITAVLENYAHAD